MKTKKLLWIDMEMTGLDVEKEVVIEVAAIVTDYSFQVLDTYETVVNQPQTYLAAMDDWNKEHHSQSGLLAKIPYGKTPDQVEEDLLKLVEKHWPQPEKKDDMPIMAGNSIGQDRLFMNKYFKKLSSKIHYRMLDVTSWKIIFNEKFSMKYEKKNSHRALDDVRESIEELKFYMSAVR
ncbi:MAG: oligoribonuclease [Pseudobdellovibrionaceae bacterium]|jgi:oligoribonuclease